MHRILPAFLIALLAACGGEEKKTPASSDPGVVFADGCGCGDGAASGSSAWSADKGTAIIKGVVKWAGDPPPERRADPGADKFCESCHPEGVPSQDTLVGADGGLANVFVQVTGGLDGWRFPTPKEPKVLDQKLCTYVPHVMGIQVKQPLEIRNSDPTMHNVHAKDRQTRRAHFNYAQSKQGAVDKESFRRPGIVDLACEVHSWMSSTIHVVAHPFYAVSGEDGAFALPKLPAGQYTVSAWHEKHGTQTQQVTLADGGTAEVAFTFRKG